MLPASETKKNNLKKNPCFRTAHTVTFPLLGMVAQRPLRL